MKIWEVKNVIYDTEIAEYLRDGMAVSDPLPIMQKDRLVDLYLVYYVNVKKNTMSEPFFTFTIDTEKGTLLSVERWNERKQREKIGSVQKNTEKREFSISNENGKDAKKEILISSDTIENRKKAKEEYENLYPEMRDYFYKESLSREIKESMKQFCHAFCLYSGEGKVNYYKQAVPEFFRWMERII